jgi:hypothetical protein
MTTQQLSKALSEIAPLCALAREIAYRWPVRLRGEDMTSRQRAQAYTRVANELSALPAQPSQLSQTSQTNTPSQPSETPEAQARRLVLLAAERLLDVLWGLGPDDAKATKAPKATQSGATQSGATQSGATDHEADQPYLHYMPLQAYQLDVTVDIEELLMRHHHRIIQSYNAESAYARAQAAAELYNRTHPGPETDQRQYARSAAVAEAALLDEWGASWYWGASEYGTLLIQLASPLLPYSIDQALPENALRRVRCSAPAALWFQGGIPNNASLMRFVGTNQDMAARLEAICAHEAAKPHD